MRGMNDLVRQAQIMQKKITKLQEELADREVEGTAGGGMVKVTVTCSQELKSIVIDKSVVDPEDVEMLQDLIMAAVGDALKVAKETQESEMTAITGGVNIPGMF